MVEPIPTIPKHWARQTALDRENPPLQVAIKIEKR